MSLALIGAAVSAAGSLFGGRKRKKAARRAAAAEAARAAAASAQADAGIAQIDVDQARALELRAADEARLKDATGFDLVRLREQAQAAGFNPLTVLQATGGAGYDGRGGVLTSPFMAKSSAMFDKANLMAGLSAGQANADRAVVEASGYIGDAFGGLGSAISGIGSAQDQRNHEFSMLQFAESGGAAGRPAIAGSTRPGAFQGARVMTESPVASTAFAGALAGAKRWFSGLGGGFDPYPGFQSVVNPVGTYPLTAEAVDPVFGASWTVANPDLDNEGLEYILGLTLPLQASYKLGGATRRLTDWASYKVGEKALQGRDWVITNYSPWIAGRFEAMRETRPLDGYPGLDEFSDPQFNQR